MFAKVLSLFLIIALLAACSPSSPPTSVASASAPVSGPLVPVGEPEIYDLGPTTETVWNCGSGGGTVVKHPSMSVVTNYAVEWEVGGTTGIGLKIGEGVIPGGVDLSASLEGHYVTGLEQGIQQGTGWDLPAEPNTIVVYTLMWREVWQPGYVDVRLADQSVIRVNVRYRTGIQSEIVGKQQQTCGEEQRLPSQPEVPVRPTVASRPTPLSQECNQGGFMPPIPAPPPPGCVLTVEWWYPPNPTPCGLWITYGAVEFDEGVAGYWWYEYDVTVPGHIRAFKEKYNYCEVKDFR